MVIGGSPPRCFCCFCKKLSATGRASTAGILEFKPCRDTKNSEEQRPSSREDRNDGYLFAHQRKSLHRLSLTRSQFSLYIIIFAICQIGRSVCCTGDVCRL